ncbi:uncharacterized protein MONBRDRAFT_13149 [Monosiga brevicollis MX1]|uniref:MULE transposase domain-containing protein n=1 Tax=Monosiga brevicollis TaxID=81824 RepID=A9VEF4_MONBE|nr:uncharacterized protein MONBRDRAFT_13149 [Monosiga brevicollis MX1]EDQ84087.1 predicted protein [Monosiga brevicollis MX1]|eukprot:XP_001751101.1 hypothetical protein [Monosiga brevicollis MX1]
MYSNSSACRFDRRGNYYHCSRHGLPPPEKRRVEQQRVAQSQEQEAGNSSLHANLDIDSRHGQHDSVMSEQAFADHQRHEDEPDCVLEQEESQKVVCYAYMWQQELDDGSFEVSILTEEPNTGRGVVIGHAFINGLSASAVARFVEVLWRFNPEVPLPAFVLTDMDRKLINGCTDAFDLLSKERGSKEIACFYCQFHVFQAWHRRLGPKAPEGLFAALKDMTLANTEAEFKSLYNYASEKYGGVTTTFKSKSCPVEYFWSYFNTNYHSEQGVTAPTTAIVFKAVPELGPVPLIVHSGLVEVEVDEWYQPCVKLNIDIMPQSVQSVVWPLRLEHTRCIYARKTSRMNRRYATLAPLGEVSESETHNTAGEHSESEQDVLLSDPAPPIAANVLDAQRKVLLKTSGHRQLLACPFGLCKCKGPRLDRKAWVNHVLREHPYDEQATDLVKQVMEAKLVAQCNKCHLFFEAAGISQHRSRCGANLKRASEALFHAAGHDLLEIMRGAWPQQCVGSRVSVCELLKLARHPLMQRSRYC